MEQEWELPTELPEASRRLAERLVEAGRHRTADDRICHPGKPDLHVTFNNEFGDFMLSPRLVEFLIEHKKPWVQILSKALSE